MFFFFNDTATTEIYTLSLHDALPISRRAFVVDDILGLLRVRITKIPDESIEPGAHRHDGIAGDEGQRVVLALDRKSTRLNSSHLVISYAVFCLKKNMQAGTPRPLRTS